MTTQNRTLPGAFIWRRLHSLMGLWLVLFLMEHLLTNSQAALIMGDHATGFVRMVNALHNLPYLHAIELTLLGVPFAIHMFFGVRYLFTGKFNSFPSSGSTPSLHYGRNHAYTFQRITSWLLLILIVMHVVKFRFLEYPQETSAGNYTVRVTEDRGLPDVAKRLGARIDRLGDNEVEVTAPDFGTATVFAVRNTFKNPIWVGIYTLFVVCACFHAFNGLWTFLLTWGWVLKVSAQRGALKIAWGLMILITFLGFMAIWGTYFKT